MVSIDAFITPDIFAWVIVPLLIFFATVCEMSLGTLRVIFIDRGFRNLSAVFGFVEVLVWLIAISQIMRNLDNFTYYIANATGFSIGVFVGMWIEDKLSIGKVIIRTIVSENAEDLLSHLKGAHFGVTSVSADGAYGPVTVILTIVDRRHVPEVVSCITKHYPHAFYSIENVKLVNEGVFPPRTGMYLKDHIFGTLRHLFHRDIAR